MNGLELLVFAAMFALAAYLHISQARDWRDERSELLNRLMSRNFGEYVAGTRESDDERPQLLTDEIETEWANAHEMKEAS